MSRYDLLTLSFELNIKFFIEIPEGPSDWNNASKTDLVKPFFTRVARPSLNWPGSEIFTIGAAVCSLQLGLKRVTRTYFLFLCSTLSRYNDPAVNLDGAGSQDDGTLLRINRLSKYTISE